MFNFLFSVSPSGKQKPACVPDCEYQNCLDDRLTQAPFVWQRNLDGYFDSINPKILQHLEQMWEQDARFVLPNRGVYDALLFVIESVYWARKHNLVPADQYVKLRNAVIQWLYEYHQIDAGYGFGRSWTVASNYKVNGC